VSDKKDNSGPAFPITAGNQVYNQGMSLRDWFAGQALVGATQIADNDHDAMAREAYRYADAMLAARKGGAA